jgi:hypothetical protein
MKVLMGIRIGQTTRINRQSIVLSYTSLTHIAILLDITDGNVHSKAMDEVALPILIQT